MTTRERLLTIATPEGGVRARLGRQEWGQVRARDPRLYDSPHREIFQFVFDAPRNPVGAISMPMLAQHAPTLSWLTSPAAVGDAVRATAAYAGMTVRMGGEVADGRLTDVVELGVPADLAGATYPASASPFFRQGFVDLVTGKPLSERMAQVRFGLTRYEVDEANSAVPLPSGVAEYLHYLHWQVPSHRFAITDEIIAKCLDAIDARCFQRATCEEDDAKSRDLYAAGIAALSTLRASVLWSRPLYAVSHRSPQLAPHGLSLATLPPPLRRMAVPGVELQLIAAEEDITRVCAVTAGDAWGRRVTREACAGYVRQSYLMRLWEDALRLCVADPGWDLLWTPPVATLLCAQRDTGRVVAELDRSVRHAGEFLGIPARVAVAWTPWAGSAQKKV
jgi:hypothetical protein